MKKTTYYLMAMFFAFYSFTYAQYTAVPDANFEQALINDGTDSEGTLDGQILTSDASARNGHLNLANQSISDLTGLEAFTILEAITVNGNPITTLDVSNSPNLIWVRARSCTNLTTVNLTGLTVVYELDFKSASLNALDVSTNIALEDLDIRNCNVTSLDLSVHPLLTSLDVKNNGLTFLDMRNGNNANTSFIGDFNPALECLYVDDTTELNLLSWIIDSNSTFVETEAECNSLDIDLAEEVSFNMYPNPTNSTLYISAKTNNAVVNIYNITGKEILTKILTRGENFVDVSNLATGVYLARFVSENKVNTKKLIIK